MAVVSTYNDAGLNAEDLQKIQALKAQYESYKASGDQAGMESSHNQAEAIRAKAGYSGGADGTGYYAIDTDVPYLRGSQSQQNYINQLYDAQKELSLASLKSAYDQNIAALDQSAEKIPAQYQAAKNKSMANSEIAKANFNEYAKSSGLNTGASGQAQLALTNAEQANQASLDLAEAEALRDIENQRLLLRTNYQNNIASAIASGDLARAQALYDEAVRVDESMVATALNQAQLNLSYTQKTTGSSGGQSTGTTDSSASSDIYPKTENTKSTANIDALVTANEYKINAGVSATQVQRDLLSMVNSGSISLQDAYQVMARLGF